MNSVQIMGRVTKDIELKYSKSEMAFINFYIAVNRDYKKEGEERQADFISCKAFGKTAEFIHRYFFKGSLIALQGKIQTGNYEKEDGSKVYTTDIIVEKVHFTGEKSKNDTGTTGVIRGQQAGFFPIDSGIDDLPF